MGGAEGKDAGQAAPGSAGYPAQGAKAGAPKASCLEKGTSGHDLATKMQGIVSVSGRYHRLPKSLEDDYIVDAKVLGSGFNGSVFQAKRKGGGPTDKFAVKEFKLRGIPRDKRAELEQECEIFLSMDHPHVARLVDVYEETDRITLVMECMAGGELFDRVIEKKRFDEKDAVVAAYQMLLAVNYLHAHGIVHRDIKLENWLYESKVGDHLKLIDFGFSKAFDPNIKMKMSCGTLSYVAPEVLTKSYTSQCDMWSLGVVLFILLAGYMPFSGPDEKQVKCIKEGNFKFKEEKWATVSTNSRDFVTKLMAVDPKVRLTAEQALQHNWIVNREKMTADAADANKDVVNSMISFAQESKFRRACMLAMAWSLSNEERTKLRSAFMTMDKNKHGTITIAEFKQVIEQHYHLEDAQIKEVFSALDAAGNNEIQYSEFLAAMVSSRVNLYDDFLQTAFKRFDTDASGFISLENLRDILGGGVSDADMQDIMNEVDGNHDGKISFEEFQDYVRGVHTSSGTDKNTMIVDKFIDSEMGQEKPLSSTPSGSERKEAQAKTRRSSMIRKEG